MTLRTQKRLASKILRVGINKVWFNPEKLDEIKDAITKADLRVLIDSNNIKKKQKVGISSFRARKKLKQKRKGRRQGYGSRKGKRTSRLSQKRQWIHKIRSQRQLLNSFKEKKFITNETFKKLYKKSKGSFFRSRNHLLLYLKENNLYLGKDHGQK